MARLRTVGFEFQVFAGAFPDGSRSASTVTFDTTNQRTGNVCAKCDSGASNLTGTATAYFDSISASTRRFVRFAVKITSYPASEIKLYSTSGWPSGPAGPLVTVNTTGNLRVNAESNSGTGSASATAIQLATWTVVEVDWSVVIVAGTSRQITVNDVRINGVSQSLTATATTPTASPTGSPTHDIGWGTAPGANRVLYLDDIAINDDIGGSENSWPGQGKVVLLIPIADSAVGSGWTNDQAQTTNLYQSVDNTPPLGIADTTTGGGGHQIRNASSAAANYDASLTSYTTAGVGASDTINVLVPWVATAAPVSTGAKTGSFGITSNPIIAQAVLANAGGQFWTGTAAGTFGTGWGFTQGTTTYAPSVTLGTSPVARVAITGGTASRIAMACFMGMYVDYTPAAAPAVTKPKRYAQSYAIAHRRAALR